MIKEALQKILLKILPIQVIERSLDELEISRCKDAVTMGARSKFYNQSRVLNFQGDKSKIRIGENCHLRGNLQIFAYGGSITIGDNCYLGENSYIWSGDKVVIGNNVLISHNVNIVDSNSHELNYKEREEGYINLIAQGHPKNKGSIITAPIIVSDNAWISFGCIILKGVTIGKGSIVAAGSVVVKDVPDWTMVGGNPATIIKEIPLNERSS